MTDTETIMTHPIFGALTRPAMTWGVTFEYHALNIMASMTAFIGTGNPLYGLVFIPFHVFGWLMCREEPRFFIIQRKRLLQIPNSPNQSIWGVRSYEPF